MTDVRAVAYEALLMADENKGGAHLTADILDKYSFLERSDRSFLKRLIEGTIERRITIDHVLDLYSKVPVPKMKKQIRTLLRMGVYQILYMYSVTDYAAVSETVRLARKTPQRSLSGFVNAVLRNVAGNKDNIPWPDKDEDTEKYLSVYYSCPEWIVEKLVGQLGKNHAKDILELSVSVRPVTARVNLSKTDVASCLDSGHRSEICDIAVVLDDYDSITDIPAFQKGHICIQDISSMLVCLAAGITESDSVLDLCAAPGGKSLHAADLAQKGSVISCDISRAKVDLIEENIRRCRFSNITARIADATVFEPEFEEAFSVVIADVPCSGLGVMGRKNDIKYNITADAISQLTGLQKKIAENAARYVRPGGTLMFSTCTCTLEENMENFKYIEKQCRLTPVDFYDRIPQKLKDESAREGYLQLYGTDLATDGFFLAKFRK